MIVIMMMLIVAIGLNNGITGLVVLNVTDTKQIGTTFTSNGDVLLTLDEIPSSITIAGEHTGITRILLNGQEFYSGEGNKTFSETKEMTGLGTEITITVEVENSSTTLASLEYTYSQETSEPIPSWNSSVTEFSIMQGETLEIDLGEYFTDDDNLTYLATGASNVTVEIYGSVLRVIPDATFAGERRIKAIASDEYNVVEQQIKIIVTANEEIIIPENITEPEENITINITPELNISENLTINITPEINITANLTENLTINITGNFTENMSINATMNMTMNLTTNLTMNITLDNITGLRFALDEKIIAENKTLGKKVQDEPDYEVYFQNITLTNESLLLEFFHDYNIPLPVFIEGNVNYTLTNITAQPNETVKVIVQLSEGILPRFTLHVGITSEVFEFGKNIPTVNTKVKKAKQMKEMTRAGTKKEVLGEMKQIHKKDNGKEKGQDKEEYWLIDRNDEKLDVELVSETAKAMIIGINASEIRTAFDAVLDKIIRTEVFAAEPTEMEEAVITLKKTGRVTAIVECTDINVETLSCLSGWKKTNIPFTDDGENITFTVTHFSGYAGAEITVLNVQSYPILYGNWTVMFNTTGTANLTVTAVDGTTWSLDGDGTQLQLLEVRCGETVLNYTWVDNSVFIADYNCSSTGYLTNKELMAGKHTLKFLFGNDTAYAYNDVYLGKWWLRGLNLKQGFNGKGQPINSSDYARGVATDTNRNIIITGWGSEGGDDIYARTIQYDEGGTIKWDAFFNKTPEPYKFGVKAYAAATDSSDNAYIGGITVNADTVCFAAKYNSAGTHQWNVTYNTTDYTVCYAMAVDSSGNVILAGYNYSATSVYSVFLAKYNTNGAQQWNTSWRGGHTQLVFWMYGAATDDSGNIYVAGHWNGSKPLLVKFNSAGTYQWSRIFNYSGRNGPANAVAVDSENNPIIGGYIQSTAGSADYNFLVAKYNSDGTELWNTTLNFTKTDVGNGIATDLENNIILTGYTDDINNNLTTLKLNKTGTQIWNTTYSYSNGLTDVGYAVTVDNKNNVVVAGIMTNGTPYGEIRERDFYDYALLKYYFDIPANSTRPILNSTDLSNRTSQNLTVYPQNTQDTLDLDSVTNVTNWYKNGKSITVLNMPFDIDTNNFTARQEKDFSPYGNNGTVTGPTWTTSGISGGAYSFDGGSDYIDMAASATFDVRNLTIEAWVYSTNFEQNMFIFEKGTVNTQYSLFFEGTNTCFRTYNQSGAAIYDSFYVDTSDMGITNSAWHYIVATYNGTYKSIYVDGKLQATQPFTGVLKTGLGTAERIGAYGGAAPSYYFNGKIDEVRVYDVALSADQILANNQSGAPKYNRIASSELVKGDVWHAEVTPVDGRFAGTSLMSNGVKIGTKPRMNLTILNSTDNTNRTSQNLTVYYLNATDIDNDVIQNVTNWYENGKSVTVLNMPFEAKKGMHEEGTNEVGIWYFENNTRDFSGNANNGSCTNCPISEAAGKVGMMYHFDGSNDAIRIPYNPNLAMVGKDFTIASWIYMDAEPDDWHGTLFSKSTPSGAGTEGYLFSIRGSNDGTNKNKLWGMIMNAGGFVESPGNTALSTNKWYHAVMTYDYSTRVVQFYLNGQPDGGFTSDRDVTDTGATSVTEIGRGLDWDGYAFNGKIDEVHVFNRSLNPSEVNAIYKKGLDQAKDTIDYSGYNNNGAVTGATWTSSGIKGGGYDFSGSSNFVNISDSGSVEITNKITVSYWVKGTFNYGASEGAILEKGGWSTGEYGMTYVNSNAPRFQIYDLSTQYVDATTSTNDGNWHNVVGTWNGTNLSIYVDGINEKSAGATGTFVPDADNLFIGSRLGTSNFFDGIIDEVQIYDRALTPEQILANYQSGAPKYDKTVSQELSRGDVWNTEVIPLDTVEDGYTGMSNGVKIGTKPTVNTVILNSTDNTNRTSKNLTVYYNGITDSDNDAVQNTTNWYENGKQIAVLNMPFEGKTSMHTATTDDVGAWYFENNTKDMSQNENDGTCTNCPTYTASGKVGGAYDFDGSNDAIELPEPPATSTSITNNGSVFAWIKTSNAGASYRGIVVKQFAYGMFLVNNVLAIHDWTDATRTTGANLADGNWHLVGFTFQSGVTSGTKVYIDGQLNLTTTMTVSSQSEGIVFGAGDNPATQQYFDGLIDEVSIFNRTLSLPEIKALYTKGLDKVNDTIDYSGYGNNGRVTGATWTGSGKKGGGYTFDGTDDKINLTLKQLNGATAFTLEMWVKPDSLPWGGWQGLFGTGPTSARTPWLYTNFDPEFIIYYSDLTLEVDTTSGAGDGVGGTTNLTQGAWNFVAFTWNGSIVSSYLDGVLIMTDETVGRTLAASNGDTQIGWIPGYSYFDGSIDEVRVYDRALTAEQILSDNASGAPKYDKTVSQELSKGEVWNTEVISTDGWEDGYGMSNGVQIGTAPTQNTPIVNSTYGTNQTNENITVYPNGGADADGDAIRNITNWYRNGTSMTVLNLPFEGKINMHMATTDDAGTWYFENNTKDMSQNENDGTCTNCPAYGASGIVGGGYGFVGTGESITVPDSPSLRLGTNQTIAVWVSYDSPNSFYSMLVGKGNSTANRNYMLLLELDGDIYYGMTDSAGGWCGAYENGGFGSKANIATGSGWHHLAATYNGTTAKVYKDGTEVYSNGCTITPDTSSDPLIIGYPGYAYDPLNGALDELHLFNRTLSAAEIRAMYKKERMESGNRTVDYSGYSNDGTVSPGTNWTSTGKIGGAYYFGTGGSSTGIAVDYTPSQNTTGNMTVEAWINITSFAPAYQYVVDKWSYTVGNYRAWSLDFGSAGVDNLSWRASVDGQDSGAKIISYNYTGKTNQWHHIVGVYNNTNLTLYVDGSQAAIGPGPASIIGTRQDTMIGAGDTGTTFSMAGYIDEVKVYNMSLTPQQILENYKAGAPDYRTIHSSETEIGDGFLAEVTPVDSIMEGLTARSNELTIRNAPPSILQFILNSSGQPTRDRDNLTCYANITDLEGDTPLHAYYNWYNNSIKIPSLSGNLSITPEIMTLLSFLGAGNTTKGEIWTCEARFYDGHTNSSWYNQTARIVEISPTVFINGVYNSIKFNANNILLKLNEIA